MTKQTEGTIAALQAEIDRLTATLARMGIRMAPQAQGVEAGEQRDHIAFGSPEHAEFLGLRKATDDDEIVVEGWALQDITAWGPAAGRDFLRGILLQKVNVLNTPPPPGQSEDPARPNFRPTMWVPGLQVGDVTTK